VNPAAKNPSGPPGPAALTPARTGKSALPRPDRKPGTRRPTPPSSVSGYALLSCCLRKRCLAFLLVSPLYVVSSGFIGVCTERGGCNELLGGAGQAQRRPGVR